MIEDTKLQSTLLKPQQLRYFLDIAYQGTAYHGWQIQANAHTVQAEIQETLSTALQESIEIMGSGRTDTGVHAEQQIAHFDTQQNLTTYKHLHQFNAMLPPDIAIKHIFKVEAEAHARFDAVSREYIYRIYHLKNPFRQNLAYFTTQNFDLSLMNAAASLLPSYTDFQCFSKVKTDVEHFNCLIYEAYWQEQEYELMFYIRANRFLRGMVRAIVGTLLEIGQGKINLDDFKNVIESKDRRQAGWAVPPQGLFLTKVTYPFKLIEA